MNGAAGVEIDGHHLALVRGRNVRNEARSRRRDASNTQLNQAPWKGNNGVLLIVGEVLVAIVDADPASFRSVDPGWTPAPFGLADVLVPSPEGRQTAG